MGAQLVKRAFAYAALHDLKPNERLVLIFMSLTALDGEDPRYFAAREQTAIALGRMVPDAVAPTDPTYDEVEATRRAAFQRVKLAIRGLVDAGAIESLKRGREGQRAEYRLVFRAVENAVALGTQNVPLAGTESVPLSGSESVPLSGSESVLQVGRNPYPQGTTHDYKNQSPGRTSPTKAPQVRPVDKSRTDEVAA